MGSLHLLVQTRCKQNYIFVLKYLSALTNTLTERLDAKTLPSARKEDEKGY